MDGLRMVDEWQSFAEQLPGEGAVFQRVGQFESVRDQLGARGALQLSDAERVFELIDGRLKVRRVIDLSLLGSFDATRALAALREAGVIAPLDVGILQNTRRRRRPAVLPRADARSWVATLVPLALLLLVAFAIHWQIVMPPRPGIFAIPPSALDLVRDDYAALRVSHALEAFRFGRGQWPERLSQLSERGILSADQLASDEGRPYYYVERAEGAVLLAPER
jgi:hypothetical protein